MRKRLMKIGKLAASFVLAAVLFALCGCASAPASNAASNANANAANAASNANASNANAGEAPAADGAVNVMALNGPTGIGIAALSRDDAYAARFVGSTDEVVSAITSKSVDIAAVPTNLASVLYNKTQGGVKVIGVSTLGSLYIMENGSTVNSLTDLAGKHLYATGQGANPQFILEHLLNQAGVSVEVEYLAEHSQLASLVAQGEAQLAMLPEPFVEVASSKNPDARIALDMGEQWQQATGVGLAMGCVVVRTEFAEEHPEAVAQFLKDLDASVKYANMSIAETAQLCADLGILPSAQVAQAAIPHCSLVCLTGETAQQAVDSFLDVLFQTNPKSVGGALPDAGFYYHAS